MVVRKCYAEPRRVEGWIPRYVEASYHNQCEGCWKYFCWEHLGPHLEKPCPVDSDLDHGRAREPWYMYDQAAVVAEKAKSGGWRKRRGGYHF